MTKPKTITKREPKALKRYKSKIIYDIAILALKTKIKSNIHFETIDEKAGKPYGWSLHLFQNLFSDKFDKVHMDDLGILFWTMDGAFLKMNISNETNLEGR